jgi:ketosteroid isomerase-like protein
MPPQVVIRRPLEVRGGPRHRRALDERLAVRFPALYRLGASALLRLPPGSRLRRALVGRFSSAFLEAWSRQDLDLTLLVFDPEVEVCLPEASPAASSSTELDQERLYRGHAGFRRFSELWNEPWDESRLEPHELLDFGDRVLILCRWVGRGRGSGVEVTQPVAMLSTLRKGRVVRWQAWWDWPEALEAVGLPESSPPASRAESSKNRPARE